MWILTNANILSEFFGTGGAVSPITTTADLPLDLKKNSAEHEISALQDR